MSQKRLYIFGTAVLTGTSFACALVLLLNLRFAGFVLSILLVPGEAILSLTSIVSQHLWPRAQDGPDFYSPFSVIGWNALAYSAIGYVVLRSRFQRIGVAQLKRSTFVLVLLTLAMIVLASIPSFNPLWPRGAADYEKKQTELRTAFPIGLGLKDAYSRLHSQGIEYRSHVTLASEVVLPASQTVVANAGDTVVTARVSTEAGQFPCHYDISVLLVFGPDEKLKQRHIGRFPMCP